MIKVVKKAVVAVNSCLECPFCAESGPKGDRCFSELLEFDTKPIEDVYAIPEWCPLEDF